MLLSLSGACPAVLDRAPEHVREGRNEAHAFVAATTGGELADHAIMTPGVVAEEMVNAAVQMTGKGGKVTIAAVGRLTERAVG